MKAHKIEPTPTYRWHREDGPRSALPPVDRCGGKRCKDCRCPTADNADRCYLCSSTKFRQDQAREEATARTRYSYGLAGLEHRPS